MERLRSVKLPRSGRTSLACRASTEWIGERRRQEVVIGKERGRLPLVGAHARVLERLRDRLERLVVR
jgi:hypothetical protein